MYADTQITEAINALRNKGSTTLSDGTKWYETQKFLLGSIARIITSSKFSDITHADDHIESLNHTLNHIKIDSENYKLYQFIISELRRIDSEKFTREDIDNYASSISRRTLPPKQIGNPQHNRRSRIN